MAERYAAATGIAAGSTPIRRYAVSPNCIAPTSSRPPPSAIQSAWRTTAPASVSRPAPCICETSGVTDIAIPDSSSMAGQ